MRVVVIALLLFSLFVDGAGYVYRVTNHYPLTGSVPGLPPNFNGWQVYFHKGLDLVGGTDLQYQMTDFPANADRATIQSAEVGVIQKRVNALGVSEALVIPGGGGSHDRIEVQIPGVTAAQAQQVIGTTAKLVITTWVPDSTVTNGPYPGYKPQVTKMTSDMLTSTSVTLNPNGSDWVVNFQFNSAGQSIFAGLSQTAFNACQTDATSATCHIPYWLDLTQSDIDNWNTLAPSLYRPYDPACHSTDPAAPCGKLLSDPIMQSAITGGQGYIQGNFSQSTAQSLSTLLNSGSLPTGLTLLSASDVGASLGQQAVNLSIAAGLLGLLIVVLFMIAFYRLPGLLASLALLCYAAGVLALFKVWPITLTLAGLAGFILSVGMAVDANVLIFERFKEEMRAGRTIAAAVDAAVRRAWPAIRDSNISTAITCSVLLIFGPNGSVKGFATTLLIGVVISMISSIIITHNLLALVLNADWARRGQIMGVSRGRA